MSGSYLFWILSLINILSIHHILLSLNIQNRLIKTYSHIDGLVLYKLNMKDWCDSKFSQLKFKYNFRIVKSRN